MAESIEVFRTPFAQKIHQAGLDCLHCPGTRRDLTDLAERYLAAYRIKEEMGLLTDTEKKMLPGLRLATKALLLAEKKEEAALIWERIHGIGKHCAYCVQPAQWQDASYRKQMRTEPVQ